jgi:hypothetical protein
MSNKIEQQENEASLSESRMPVSLYLKIEILDKIEEILYHAKKNLPRQKRTKLNKSRLYELLLEAAIADNKLVSNIVSDFENS